MLTVTLRGVRSIMASIMKQFGDVYWSFSLFPKAKIRKKNGKACHFPENNQYACLCTPLDGAVKQLLQVVPHGEELQTDGLRVVEDNEDVNVDQRAVFPRHGRRNRRTRPSGRAAS